MSPSTEAKPSAKQVYFLARLLVEQAGLSWPQSKADASEIIASLKALETSSTDDIPF